MLNTPSIGKPKWQKSWTVFSSKVSIHTFSFSSIHLMTVRYFKNGPRILMGLSKNFPRGVDWYSRSKKACNSLTKKQNLPAKKKKLYWVCGILKSELKTKNNIHPTTMYAHTHIHKSYTVTWNGQQLWTNWSMDGPDFVDNTRNDADETCVNFFIYFSFYILLKFMTDQYFLMCRLYSL